MADPHLKGTDWRDRVLGDPDMILSDRDVMAALVAASERAAGPTVVDMRGQAMDRLRARLSRLEDTHRSVVGAAYDNLSGTNQVHRVLLMLLEAASFVELLDVLTFDAAEAFRIETVRLVLETTGPGTVPHSGVVAVGAGFVERHMGARAVTLRAVGEGSARIYDRSGPRLRSEACVRLDLGPGRLPGMVAFGAADAAQFGPHQGTELLAFFGQALERLIRRHLDG
ncbi:DUF484 family protein [Jannaschia sp. Os4]|uniref:DUF484 family protein n=1 Tax=Jannaschia sp. Os4 TaxID=2807617 RepID=UPI001939C3A6|nr:DUF484 family protein [Jannaschia sp. Os4]MBM2575980.1 DUF484 family protein [Jannaschia sp. Os4]